jgi:hypothetical protein
MGAAGFAWDHTAARETFLRSCREVLPPSLMEIVEELADAADEHERCPVYCEGCNQHERPRSCPSCSGSGCSPETARGAYSPCLDCDGDGRDHMPAGPPP